MLFAVLEHAWPVASEMSGQGLSRFHEGSYSGGVSLGLNSDRVFTGIVFLKCTEFEDGVILEDGNGMLREGCSGN